MQPRGGSRTPASASSTQSQGPLPHARTGRVLPAVSAEGTTALDGEMAFLRPLFGRLAVRSPDDPLPFVTLSYAQSIDGSIALRPARPVRLSSERAFVMTHLLRARHDALLIGIHTVLADNPRLTVRLCAGSNPQPVVLDSRLRIPEDALLFAHPDRRPWIFTTEAAPAAKRARLEQRGAAVHVMPSDEYGRVELTAVLRHLCAQRVTGLMVEGGATVIRSFLQQRLVDYFVITVAPKLLFGGLHAMDHEESGPLPPLAIDECGYQPLGGDLIIHGRLRPA
jgi:GTP cyclohydrolase II